MTRLVPRTRLTYRDGAYYVGAPNYEPGEVVTDSDAAKLEAVIEEAVFLRSELLCAWHGKSAPHKECRCLMCNSARRYDAALAALKEAK